MSNINQISVLIKTGAQGMAAGTHGEAYLSIGCKEYHLTEFKDKDFQPGLAQTIVLSGLDQPIVLGEETGADSSKDKSDLYCLHQQIDSENLSKCPLFIRFEPESKDDYWDLVEIRVTVDAGSEHIIFSALGEKSYLWSGVRGPKVMFLGETTTTH